MGYELVNLQGYAFEVEHSTYEVPADLPQVPGGPVPGSSIAVHTLNFMDPIYRPTGELVGVRKVYQVELTDRQVDELVRQLQGGAPQAAHSAIAVAGASALSHLPPIHAKPGG